MFHQPDKRLVHCLSECNQCHNEMSHSGNIVVFQVVYGSCWLGPKVVPFSGMKTLKAGQSANVIRNQSQKTTMF